jgi:hypothetical protein
MTNDPIERPLDRRLLLRGGAVLAGAAGVTAIGAALAPSVAQAADGQFAVVGESNTSQSTTSYTINAPDGSEQPALSLANASGPALRLDPVGPNYNGNLALGEIAYTLRGPEVGVQQGLGVQTTWLATGLDLDQIPIALPIVPERLLDTRVEGGRSQIKTTSADAFDSNFRLTAGAWMDVAIIPSGFYGLDAAFVNVTAVKPVREGFLTVYPPGARPLASTVNFEEGKTIANGAFILTGIAVEDKDWYVIRIFTTAVTHLVVDLTGVTLRGVSGANPSQRGLARQRNAAKANRMKRVFRY